jgi:hypothetical protein
MAAFACWIVLFIVFYAIIPIFSWVFFGTFSEVAQHPFYACIGIIGSIIAACVVCSMAIDEDFYFKK